MSLEHGASNDGMSAQDGPAASARLALDASASVAGRVSLRQPPVIRETNGLTVTGSAVSAETGHAKVALSVHTDLDDVEAEWRAFERVADRTAFQSFDWLGTWQRHIGGPAGTVPVIVVGRCELGETLFLLPLAIDRERFSRRLTWLGAERSDYNAPMLAPSLPKRGLDWRSLWPTIVRAIRDRRLKFDLVDLRKMPEMVGDQPNGLMFVPAVRHPNDAHVATLSENWDEFYKSKRSSSSRKVQRKHLNRLAEHGELRFIDSGDAEVVEATLGTLVEQKARALARMGIGNMFERPGIRNFYADLASDPSGSGAVHVSRLDVGTHVAATNMGLIHDGRYCLILSSYNDGALSRFGPGRAHLHELLRFAIERGLKEFDFTIGNEPYKLDWCDVRVPLFDHLSAVTLRGVLMKPPMSALRWLRREIRNNETAWRLYTKIRLWAYGMKRLTRRG